MPRVLVAVLALLASQLGVARAAVGQGCLRSATAVVGRADGVTAPTGVARSHASHHTADVAIPAGADRGELPPASAVAPGCTIAWALAAAHDVPQAAHLAVGAGTPRRDERATLRNLPAPPLPPPRAI